MQHDQHVKEYLLSEKAGWNDVVVRFLNVWTIMHINDAQDMGYDV